MRFLLALLCVLSLARPVRADRPHDIFDDDWTPPKSPATPSKPPTPVPAQRTPNLPPQAPTPAPKAPAPAVATGAQPAKLAVPSPAAQAAVRKLMKEVFAAQLADRTVPARRKLTAALFAQVEKSGDAPTDRFVLLAAAIDSAVGSADLPAAFKAADEMAETFDVDPVAIKVDAALKLGPRSNVPDMAGENIAAVTEMADQLGQADEFVTAIKVCAALQPAAGSNPALRTQLQQRIRDLGAARDAADRFQRDRARLAAHPDDPAANLAVGRYLCFVKNDWHAGLPMLAKSSDALLSAPAVLERSDLHSAEETTRLGDLWWNAAEKQSDRVSKIAVTRHAADIYTRVVDEVAGLRQMQIQQRIEEAEKIAARTADGIDLLKLVGKRFKSDTDYWSLTPTGLKCTNHGTALLPYAPPEEYDLRVTFERLASTGDSISTICPLPRGTVAWVAGGWGNVVFGFVVNKGGWTAVTKRELPADTIRKNVRYTCVIKVRKTQATAFLEGKLVSEFAGDGTGCPVDGSDFNGKAVIGFAVGTPVNVSEITLTEITGQGHIVTAPK
jgi:hypothetical protein